MVRFARALFTDCESPSSRLGGFRPPAPTSPPTYLVPDVPAGTLHPPATLLERFGTFTVEKWKQHGFRLVGFRTPLLGEKSNQVVYIWAWESVED